MWNLKQTKWKQTHSYREQIGGCPGEGIEMYQLVVIKAVTGL